MIQIKKTILTLVALLAVTAGAWADGIVCTASDLGKVLCTDGSIYENVSAATTAGKTAAAVIAYVDETNKNALAIALADEAESDWSTAVSTCEGKTAITGAKWCLPSQDQWINMFKANGGAATSYTGLNTTITNAGGTTLKNNVYWSSSETNPGSVAYVVSLVDGSAYWGYMTEDNVYRVRACLAFDIASSAATGPEVAWDKAKKTGTFTMPGGNVELEPEYYPQAALATGGAPTAINDVPATTDGAIVNAGTVATIGSTETAQGTVMYYVSPTALDDAALLALAAEAWTADVPTAESFTAAGTAYVYYYVRGNDSDTDDEIFSDGDILSANALTVTIAAAPTYAVTFAEGTDPNEWTASPNADVTKGQTVTVTYTGSKKVIGVKAEKKAEAPAETTVTLTTGEIGDLTSWGSNSKTINGITIAVSGDAHFFTTGYMEVSAYDTETGDPIPSTGTYTFTSSVGKIKQIDINHNGGKWWGSGDGWPGSYQVYHSSTFTWSGTPAASVTLNGSCNEEDQCAFDVSSIVITLEPTN